MGLSAVYSYPVGTLLGKHLILETISLTLISLASNSFFEHASIHVTPNVVLILNALNGYTSYNFQDLT